MKYDEFLKIANTTNFESKQHFLLWKTWRFELSSYLSEAINEYIAFNPKYKNVRDMFRSDNNIGIILKKFRKMRAVTKEGVEEKLFNMPKILSNCDVEHDGGRNIGVISFPLVYIRCPECFVTVKKMSGEGIWLCFCGHYWIDPFYNIETIMKVRGIVDTTTPKQNINKLEEELPF